MNGLTVVLNSDLTLYVLTLYVYHLGCDLGGLEILDSSS